MDPNACVREMVGLANLILDGKENSEEAAHDLAEMVANLDFWLTKGGFLPERWVSPHEA